MITAHAASSDVTRTWPTISGRPKGPAGLWSRLATILWLSCLVTAPAFGQSRLAHGPFHANWSLNVPNRAFEVVVNLDHYPDLEAGRALLSIASEPARGAGFHCPNDGIGFGGAVSGAFCGEIYERAQRDGLGTEVAGVRYAGDQAIIAWRFADEPTLRLLVITGTGPDARMSLVDPRRGVDASYGAIRRPHDCEFTMCQFGGDFARDDILADPQAALGPTADLEFLRRFRDMVELQVPGAQSPGDEVPPAWAGETDVSSVQGAWTVYDGRSGESLITLDLQHTPGDPSVTGRGRVVGGSLAIQGADVIADGAVTADATDLRLSAGDGFGRLVIGGGNGPILSGTLFVNGMSYPIELRSSGMPPPEVASNGQGSAGAAATGWLPRFGGQALSYWNHNGSGMAWESRGDDRWIWYYRPRPGLAGVGVGQGTLLFEGRRSGDRMVGTAYTFSGPCGPAGFAVDGPISANDERVSMTGTAPRRDEACNVVARRGERLDFTFIAMQPDDIGPAEIDTFDAPGIGVSGTAFRATGLSPGDVLNVRIDPTTRAEIVGGLTGRERVTVARCTPAVDAARWQASGYQARRGMIARAWCLVSANDLRGWAYGQYLEPLE